MAGKGASSAHAPRALREGGHSPDGRSALPASPGGDDPATIEPVDPDVLRLRRDYAGKIDQSWRNSVVAIFDVGRHLLDAKDLLPHGQFEAMIREDLPFAPRTARALMTIPKNEWIEAHVMERQHVAVLPCGWSTLVQIARLHPDECEQLRLDGVIKPDMRRNDVESYIKLCMRQKKHAGLAEASALALSEIGVKKYGLGVFDIPWKTEARSDKGLLRSADNHYPTMTVDEIAKLPISDMFLDDCAMFMWVTNPHLASGIRILEEAYGFRYVSNWCWNKVGFQGHGYWGREAHELLLIGRKGEKVGPPVHVPRSVWDFQYLGHSVKPPEFYNFIADEYSALPLVEGFGRKDHPKDPRFDVWGNEANGVGAFPDTDPEPNAEALPHLVEGGQK